MAHAIGCIGSSLDLRTKGAARDKMSPEQRARNAKLVPRRNQDRRIGFVKIIRPGESPKVRAIRHGHAHHVAQAYIFATVEVVKNEKGLPLTLKRPKVKRS